jgi:tRNA-splicing ligase RtcB
MAPAEAFDGPLQPAGDYTYRIPKSYKPGMRVDGLIWADENLIDAIRGDNAPEQVANVATLPGIVRASMAMPDIHWGYGFPIGGVAAMDPDDGGVVSPGGVGYDINCGVRLVRSDLARDDVADRMEDLLGALFSAVPCGVGTGGPKKYADSELKRLLREGSAYVVRHGQGWDEDLDRTEAGGCLDGADPAAVSKRALERGRTQVGSLGAGNHFLEIQAVDEVYDADVAEAFGLDQDTVTFMIHCGSRGFGHQVCDDFLKVMRKAAGAYGIDLPDRQLCCAPVESDEGRRYMAAMRAAANFAWANRQRLMHIVRETTGGVFGRSAERLGMHLVYDVCHNIAKMETHETPAGRRRLCVHRKGATRAFPAGHPEVPEVYREVGQPVLIPGDMGRYSFLLVGQSRAMDETFGSVCHGAGRAMSRGQARRTVRGEDVRRRLGQKGILVMSRSAKGLAEEFSGAYKDVAHVVDVVERAGLARRVCRLHPLGVIKG